MDRARALPDPPGRLKPPSCSIIPRRAGVLLRLGRARLLRAADRSFLQPVLTLITGTAVAHLLVLAARPVLTRLFEPAAFGVLTVFVALAAILTTVSAGRYEDALMLPRRRLAAANLLVLALGLTALSGLASLLVLPLADTVGGWLGGGEMATAVRWLPAAVVLMGGSLVLESWHTRAQRFALLSVGRTAQSALTVAVQLVAGVLAVGAVGLVVGAAAGFAALFGVLLVAAWLQDRSLARGLGLAWMRRLAVRYERFPRYSGPAALLNVLSGRAPVLLLAVLFAAEVVGHYGVAFGTLALPVGIATAAVGQVFFVRAAEAARTGALDVLTRRVFRQLLVIAVYPMLVVMAAGPHLFAFVFGGEWATAGAYARWLAPWLLFAAVAPPLTRLFDVLERQRADLAFGAALLTVQGGVMVAAGLVTDAQTTIALLAIAGMGMRMGQIGYMLHLAGVPLRQAAGEAARVLAAALPPVAAVLLAASATGSGGWALVAAALGGGLYLVLARRG